MILCFMSLSALFGILNGWDHEKALCNEALYSNLISLHICSLIIAYIQTLFESPYIMLANSENDQTVWQHLLTRAQLLKTNNVVS